MSLSSLALTALRRHDTEAVRALLPRVHAAAREAGHDRSDGLAVAAWLAWQDGRPDEVFRLAAEIEKLNVASIGWSAMYRWVYLFPLLAARLRAGELETAVAVARQLIDPSQQALPDDLTAALTEACESWAQHNEKKTTERLTQALALALALASSYF
jgi:hypothetical protein